MSYIQTTAGILKTINVVVGLLAVALYGAGHDKHNLSKAKVRECPGNGEPCAEAWAGNMGMSIVILAWLFSIAILFISLFTKLTWNSAFGKLDVFSHLIFGILLIAANAMIIVYIITTARFLCLSMKALTATIPANLQKDGAGKCTAHDIFITFKFVYWLVGLIFAVGAMFLFFITSFAVKRQAAQATVEPTTSIPMNGVKY